MHKQFWTEVWNFLYPSLQINKYKDSCRDRKTSGVPHCIEKTVHVASIELVHRPVKGKLSFQGFILDTRIQL